MGACRRHELHSLLNANVKDLNNTLVVNIINTKNKLERMFTITNKYYNIIKKYMKLRPENCKNDHFFIRYHNGKCSSQNIGINTFGNIGKMVAGYMKLPNPELYTGHCFRRTSATMLIDAGGNIETLKRHGGWKSTSVAEGYIDNSVQSKIAVSNTILNAIENNNAPPTSTSTVTKEPQAPSPASPTFTPMHLSQSPNATPKEFNLSQIVKTNTPIIITKNSINNLHIHYVESNARSDVDALMSNN
ncbi:uncharacterized protein LOC125241445 [Leguminivora glycinivorella]|uniref:uncharacterized protein LOC125241445 n=1 Tax=Leguminivora glycinivorella TaxID=1035111 RepID=UPI00201065E3|nr:uncharacterized protein LOC125241445 [Leguminivora glycinivorella]